VVTDPGTTSIAVAVGERRVRSASERDDGWTALRAVDWRPRTYELVAATFGVIVLLLLRETPLPLSSGLAWYLAEKGALTVAGVYGVGLAIAAGRVALDGVRHGAAGLTDPRRAVPLLLPYVSLDFFVLTLRRALAVFTGVFFFLHLKHVVLWLHFANYDQVFWDLDRWLHAGVQPNVWLMERLGPQHDVALLLDWLYIKYFDYKVLVSLVFLCELGGRRLSEQFVLAYTLLWVLGGLAYLAMPADGPCYAVLLGATDIPAAGRQWGFPYPIVTELPATYVEAFRDAKIWTAKGLQHTLWTTRWGFVYQGKLPDMFYGVAAMPSLHVAAVVLLAYFLARLSFWAGLVGVAYATAIAVGSVFLQWHYAVDGYAGALLAACTAWIAVRLAPDRDEVPGCRTPSTGEPAGD
jgi:hypothetical protein